MKKVRASLVGAKPARIETAVASSVSKPTQAPAQDSHSTNSLIGDGIHVGAIWKSPRDRTQAIQVTLREYHGNPYADCRLFVMNGSGHMVPTQKGLTVSVRQLGKLTKLIGDAYRKASSLGLTAVSS